MGKDPFMYKQIENIHFIGIGGIGMSGIAELVVSLGYGVTGSDLGRGESVKRLEALGVKVEHAAVEPILAEVKAAMRRLRRVLSDDEVRDIATRCTERK